MLTKRSSIEWKFTCFGISGNQLTFRYRNAPVNPLESFGSHWVTLGGNASTKSILVELPFCGSAQSQLWSGRHRISQARCHSMAESRALYKAILRPELAILERAY